MKFAAAVLLGVVLFADASEAHRSRRRHRHRGGSTKLRCKYVEEATVKKPDSLMVAFGQRSSVTDPNPNPIRIGGFARTDDAAGGDILSLKSFDAAGCTGTEKVISSAIPAVERICSWTGTTYVVARIPRETQDTSGADISTFASFQLVGPAGTGGTPGSALMCCDTEPSTRMLYSEFLLN